MVRSMGLAGAGVVQLMVVARVSVELCKPDDGLVFIVMVTLRYYDITVSPWRPTCCY